MFSQKTIKPSQKRAPREWTQTPFFVYGTLRPGQHNYAHYLRGFTLGELCATLPGASMYSLRHFPVILEDNPLGQVQGDLLFVKPDQYGRVCRALDALEGYDPRHPDAGFGLYQRVRRRVHLQTLNGTVAESWAWIYVGRPAVLAHYEKTNVPSGDWLMHLKMQEDLNATE
jgi:gamma-glutamylcyclotransferase (GGCT)/AIG2-like uncharacterized protein YtfP